MCVCFPSQMKYITFVVLLRVGAFVVTGFSLNTLSVEHVICCTLKEKIDQDVMGHLYVLNAYYLQPYCLFVLSAETLCIR